MKRMKKPLLICLCLVAVLAVGVVGTLAWLTDTESVKNTFTMGQVDITVDEAKVNPDGTPVAGADRVTGNSYHLIPGQTYTKDPTVTVEADSEEAYVRMLVTINCKSQLDAIFAPGVKLDSIFDGWDSTVWNYYGETEDTAANTVTFEFRYQNTVAPNGADVVLEPLFESFTIPGTLDGEDLQSILGLNITVVGHAIQAAGFDTEAAAWDAFDLQVNP